MTETALLATVAEGVATLTLNRPQRLNAFTAALHEELAAALQRLADDDDVRALMITGSGRGFCAGQDLSERKPIPGGAQRDLGGGVERYYNPLIRRLRELEKPVVAAVNGVAAGAGAGLAFARDIVIAAPSASFVEAFSRLGLVPDAADPWFPARLAGLARANAMALHGVAV